MVNDDLPAFVGIFEDEGEQAFGDATVLLAALKVVFSDDDGEVLIEGMNFKVRVAEGAHGGLVGVVVFVLVEQTSESAGDLVGDNERVRRVLEGVGEGREIALVPGVLLGEEDLDYVEFLAGGGVERIRRLRVQDPGIRRVKKTTAKWREKRSFICDLEGELLCSNLLLRLFHGTRVISGRIDSRRSGNCRPDKRLG